jgi:hypothetical protein
MTPRSRSRWTVLSCMALAAGVRAGDPEPTPAGPEKAKLKEPSPVKVLQAAVKNLQKQKGYRVGVDILGGLSMTEDHAVSLKNVQSSYHGEVFGPLMKVEDPKVFRTAKGGAAFIDGQWRQSLGDPKTVLLERLFSFPEVILAKAVKNAPASARWVKESETLVKSDVVSSADDRVIIPPDDEETGAAATGRTVVVKKKPAVSPEEEFYKTYRIIRVEAPPQEALQNFTEVQNSNCFGGG